MAGGAPARRASSDGTRRQASVGAQGSGACLHFSTVECEGAAATYQSLPDPMSVEINVLMRRPRDDSNRPCFGASTDVGNQA